MAKRQYFQVLLILICLLWGIPQNTTASRLAQPVLQNTATTTGPRGARLAARSQNTAIVGASGASSVGVESLMAGTAKPVLDSAQVQSVAASVPVDYSKVAEGVRQLRRAAGVTVVGGFLFVAPSPPFMGTVTTLGGLLWGYGGGKKLTRGAPPPRMLQGVQFSQESVENALNNVIHHAKYNERISMFLSKAKEIEKSSPSDQADLWAKFFRQHPQVKSSIEDFSQNIAVLGHVPTRQILSAGKGFLLGRGRYIFKDYIGLRKAHYRQKPELSGAMAERSTREVKRTLQEQQSQQTERLLRQSFRHQDIPELQGL